MYTTAAKKKIQEIACDQRWQVRWLVYQVAGTTSINNYPLRDIAPQHSIFDQLCIDVFVGWQVIGYGVIKSMVMVSAGL